MLNIKADAGAGPEMNEYEIANRQSHQNGVMKRVDVEVSSHMPDGSRMSPTGLSGRQF